LSWGKITDLEIGKVTDLELGVQVPTLEIGGVITDLELGIDH
jgi:hypothetical protein